MVAIVADYKRQAPTARIWQGMRIGLRDGTDILVRPIQPADEGRETDFVQGLSRESAYNRLFSARRLTREEILRLTHIDYDQEMALVALSVDAQPARMLGVARYVRDRTGEDAEFALVVADAWQKRGVGSILLSLLADQARASGVGRLHGITLASNLAMLNLARSQGYALEQVAGDATVRRLTKRLKPAPPMATFAVQPRCLDAVAANDAVSGARAGTSASIERVGGA